MPRCLKISDPPNNMKVVPRMDLGPRLLRIAVYIYMHGHIIITYIYIFDIDAILVADCLNVGISPCCIAGQPVAAHTFAESCWLKLIGKDVGLTPRLRFVSSSHGTLLLESIWFHFVRELHRLFFEPFSEMFLKTQVEFAKTLSNLCQIVV